MDRSSKKHLCSFFFAMLVASFLIVIQSINSNVEINIYFSTIKYLFNIFQGGFIGYVFFYNFYGYLDFLTKQKIRAIKNKSTEYDQEIEEEDKKKEANSSKKDKQ